MHGSGKPGYVSETPCSLLLTSSHHHSLNQIQMTAKWVSPNPIIVQPSNETLSLHICKKKYHPTATICLIAQLPCPLFDQLMGQSFSEFVFFKIDLECLMGMNQNNIGSTTNCRIYKYISLYESRDSGFDFSEVLKINIGV